MDEQAPKTPHQEQAVPGHSAPAEAGYDAWARAKIEAALKEAIDHPQDRVSLDEVWKRFGLGH